jgi:hypothetical protein
MRIPQFITSLGILVLLVGCPTADDDDTTGQPPGGDDDTGDDDDGSGLIARIAVVEATDQESGTASSSVVVWGIHDSGWADGIVPDWVLGCDGEGDTGVWEILESAGDCLVAALRPCSGDCDPSCELGSYCTPDAACEPLPERRDAGLLTVGGLSVPVSIAPLENGLYPPPAGLPADLYEPGDDIALVAAGGDTPAFSASAVAQAGLEAELPCDQVPPPEQELTVTWTPAETGSRVRWEMLQNIHNSQGPRIRCETDDSGSLSVAAALITRYSHGPEHTFTLTRYDMQEVAATDEALVAFEVQASRTCQID